MRLDKLLAHAGCGSRSQVSALCRQGRVTVNGQPAASPAMAVLPQAEVRVDGQPVTYQQNFYVLLNKPAGLLTAARDSRQPTVMQLLPALFTTRKVMPVGRLDRDTTGALLLTNHGPLAHALLSPARQVQKVYHAQLERPVGPEAVAAFAAGIPLEDFTALPAVLEPLENSCARVTLHEGKFHQVKRMFAAVGSPVVTLHREVFAGLAVASLPVGQYRELSAAEVAALFSLAGLDQPE